MSALPESQSADTWADAQHRTWCRTLQDMVGMGCVESWGVILLKVGIAWSQSWWMCKVLWLSWISSALTVLEWGWEAGPLKPYSWKLAHAACQQTPMKGEERRQEVGGRGWDGRELLLSSPNKKVRSRCLILHCLFWSVYSMCVCEESSRWLLSGDELQKAKCGKWFLKGFWGKRRENSFKNSVNVVKTNSSRSAEF